MVSVDSRRRRGGAGGRAGAGDADRRGLLLEFSAGAVLPFGFGDGERDLIPSILFLSQPLFAELILKC